MSWRIVEAVDVTEELTPAEVATLRNIQDAEERLPLVLGRVVAAVRGKIVAGGTTLGAAETVPDQVRTDVVDIARWRWLTAFPQLRSMQTEARQKLHDEAVKRLEDVAAGKVRVESADATTPAAQVTMPSVTARTRTFDRDSQDGI